MSEGRLKVLLLELQKARETFLKIEEPNDIIYTKYKIRVFFN